MKKIYVSGLMLVLSTVALAQQESQFSTVNMNPYLINPAAGGMFDVIQIEGLGRTQWTGYNGGPKTMVLSGNSQIRIAGKGEQNKEFNLEDKTMFESPERSTGNLKHIVGAKFTNDAIGVFGKTSLFGSYAIHIPLAGNMNIGAGLGLGWSNFKINQERVKLDESDDLSYSQFLGSTSSQNTMDANAGLVVYSDKLFIGLSTVQILKNNIVFDDVNTNSYLNRHYFLSGSYKMDINSTMAVEPYLVGKFAGKSPMSLDLGARFIMNNNSWLGVQYRTSNAISVQLGANLVKSLYLSYAYDMAIGKIKTASMGTHEIRLGIYIGKNRNIEKELKEKGN